MLLNSLSKTSQKILSFLADNPDQQFYGSQISKMANVSMGASNQILKELTLKKFVIAEKKGRMIFYKIDKNHPLVKQIKTTNTISRLSGLMSALKGECLEVILFGSAARGENSIDSDIDLFVVSHNPDQVKKIIKKRYNKTLPIEPIVKTPNQWADIESKDKEFFLEVSRGIILYQNHD